ISKIKAEMKGWPLRMEELLLSLSLAKDFYFRIQHHHILDKIAVIWQVPLRTKPESKGQTIACPLATQVREKPIGGRCLVIRRCVKARNDKVRLSFNYGPG